MQLSQYISGETNWLAVAGVTLSAAGLGVKIWFYRRAARVGDETINDHTEFVLGGEAEAQLSGWRARVDFNAKGVRSSRKGRRNRSSRRGRRNAIRSIFGSGDQIELDELESALKELRPSYTMHEVAAYYAAMSDEDLGIEADIDSDAA